MQLLCLWVKPGMRNFRFCENVQMLGGKYSSFIFGGKFKFQNLNVNKSFSVVRDCGKITFLGLVGALQHMRKSLDMIILHLFHIHFEPNNTFPQHLYPHVALFDPIGSPLVQSVLMLNDDATNERRRHLWRRVVT